MTLEARVQQSLYEVASRIQEYMQGVQNWPGRLPLVISHRFLEKGEECGWLVEIIQVEDWMHCLDLHCLGCDKTFKVYYKDFGLEDILHIGRA